MKFAKGILSDNEDNEPDRRGTVKLSAADREVAPPPEGSEVPDTPLPTVGAARGPVAVEKDRLFQTVDHGARSGRKHVFVLLAVCSIVAIGGCAVWYAMRPGIGDRVTAPRGLEQAIRENFLDKQKREATDIAYYLCDGYYWMRVGVTIRTDMPNPIWRIDTYSAKASQIDNVWSIADAAPAASPESLIPCS